jgi:hypothetical protein
MMKTLMLAVALAAASAPLGTSQDAATYTATVKIDDV